MKIVIENCSSPGAYFSKNTNEVLLKIYEWIDNNDNPELPFIEFRRRLESEAKINDNNARNIYPLLKNGGLVEYQPGEELSSRDFFTKRGLAYISALKARDELLQSDDFSKQQKDAAIAPFNEILSSIVYDSLKLLLKNDELNYSEGLRWYLTFLSKYRKINKREFAYMVYIMTKNEDIESTKDVIEEYRKQQIDIEVQVRVRNESTGKKTKVEDISKFTAYSYYSGLINQAGLIKKVKDYFYIADGKEEKIAYLLEE